MLKQKASMRLDRRYLLIEASKKDIENAILEYIGVLGWAKAAPFFVQEKSGKVVLAVNRKELNNVRAAFALCKNQINVLKVSGTLKGLNKK